MRVLVTGASSPLGEAVCRSLRRRRAHVTGTVRRARAGWSSPDVDDVRLLELTDQETFSAFDGRFDSAIHVAAASTGDPALLMNTTGLGTLRLIQRLTELAVPRVVMVSGMDAFGTISTPTVSHLTPPKFQRPYGVAKWAAESYLFGQRDSLQGVSVRAPAILGRRHTRHFLARTLAAMRAGQPVIEAHSPQFAFNNAVHESTLANFLVGLATADTFPGVQALTVGSSDAMPLADVIDILRASTQFQGSVRWCDPTSSPFNVDFGYSMLFGFQPESLRVSLERWLADVPSSKRASP